MVEVHGFHLLVKKRYFFFSYHLFAFEYSLWTFQHHLTCSSIVDFLDNYFIHLVIETHKLFQSIHFSFPLLRSVFPVGSSTFCSVGKSILLFLSERPSTHKQVYFILRPFCNHKKQHQDSCGTVFLHFLDPCGTAFLYFLDPRPSESPIKSLFCLCVCL